LLKKIVYSGLMEILKDPKYYYNSFAGYSRFTEEGEKQLLAYMVHMGPSMIKQELEELDALAKKLVVQELKK